MLIFINVYQHWTCRLQMKNIDILHVCIIKTNMPVLKIGVCFNPPKYVVSIICYKKMKDATILCFFDFNKSMYALFYKLLSFCQYHYTFSSGSYCWCCYWCISIVNKILLKTLTYFYLSQNVNIISSPFLLVDK